MQEKYYKKFFYVLKKFATCENYKISYNLFGNEYELRLEKENLIFYVIVNNEKKYINFKDAYIVIKEFVQTVLRCNQKYKFRFHSNSKNKFKIHSKRKNKHILNENQEKLYKRLIELFTSYLYNEYIIPTNALLMVDNEIIKECFLDTNVSIEFLRKFLEAIILCDKAFVEARISGDALLKDENLYSLQKENYVIIKEKNGQVEEILLKEKFLNAVKKMTLMIAYKEA